MKKLRFDNFVLDPDSVTLVKEREFIVLEPKAFELLLYLCQNPERVISRDELLEKIWKGVIVSDNTINKMVADLRKSLGDDARQPKFVQTVPKLGYRFIASVNLVAPESHDVKSRSAASGFPIAPALLMALLISLIVFWPSDPIPRVSSDMETLTRFMGNKQSPVVDATGEKLWFLNTTNNKKLLWEKSLVSDELREVPHQLSEIELLIDVTADNQLVLLGSFEGQRRIFKAEIGDGLKVTSSSAVTFENKRIFDADYHMEEDKLFWIQQADGAGLSELVSLGFYETQSSAISLNLSNETQLTRIDLSPMLDKLLVVAQHHNTTTTVYEYNLLEGESKIFKEFDTLVRNAIWHQNNVDILYTETPPAQRVRQLSSQEEGIGLVVASSSEYLCCDLTRISGTSDIVFRTNIQDYNNRWLTSQSFDIDNAPIYDMLPSLFHHSDGLAFVSKRSGRSQIYLQYPNQRPVQLSAFDRYKVIRSLDVSPDDLKLVAAEENKLSVFDIGESERALRLEKSFDYRLVNAAWLDQEHIVALFIQSGVQFTSVFDRELNLIQRLPSKWKWIFSAHNDTEQLWAVEVDNNLFRFSMEVIKDWQFSKGEFITPVHASAFYDFIADEHKVYQLLPRGNKVIVYKENNGSWQRVDQEVPRTYGFDVANGQVVVSQLERSNSELHRTRNVER